jgi:long-subunit fatty acid transport protein
MKLPTIIGVLSVGGAASAGGLLLPGAGAISTARAGASVASTDDAEAIAMNPAGIAKSEGTFIQLGISLIDYAMTFQRNGSYDPIKEEAVSYAGSPYPLMTNDAHPPLGFGNWQPVPVIAVVSDLGGRVPGMHAAFGLYAPNAYPFRDLNTVNGQPYYSGTDADHLLPAVFGSPPPPTRYDIIHEDAAVILPSLAVSYRVMPELDLGARISAGTAQLNSTVAVWGVPANYEEYDKQDGLFTLHAKDNFVPAAGLGAAYRPMPNVEIGARYNFPIQIHASGDAISNNGPAVTLNGAPIVVLPVPDDAARCAKGGTMAKLKGCVDVELPMTGSVGGRYKFMEPDGKKEKGDVELDVDWERWGKTCDYTKDPTCLDASDFKVTVDGQVATASNPNNGIDLKDQRISHGLQNTYAVRVGGSWRFPAGANEVIARGGVSYDTAAAKKGWERVDLDGAARTTIAAGASYKAGKLQLDAGFGFVLEGTRTDSRSCNPTGDPGSMGCGPGGVRQELQNRQGPDPIVPIIVPEQQSENPVNQGTYTSHYLMILVGASYHF